MKNIILSVFSFVCANYSLYGQASVTGTYAYPTLSSLDDISSYLSTPSSQSSLLSPMKTDMSWTGFFVTIYETSPGLKDLLYLTTRFQFQEGGETMIQDLAGPTGSKLTARKGQATFLSKDKKVMVFLHRDDRFPQDFTNVLQLSSEEGGELLTTYGKEYLKGYVRLERKKSSAISPTN